jgi:hypothetical protein
MGMEVKDIKTPCPKCASTDVHYVPDWTPWPRTREPKSPLASLLQERFTRIWATCDRCKHSARHEIETLVSLYGVKASARLDQIEDFMRCTRCGHKCASVMPDHTSAPPAFGTPGYWDWVGQQGNRG